MLQNAERLRASDAEPSKDFDKSFPANVYIHNSFTLTLLQARRIRQRFGISESVALVVAELAFASGRYA